MARSDRRRTRPQAPRAGDTGGEAGDARPGGDRPDRYCRAPGCCCAPSTICPKRGNAVEMRNLRPSFEPLIDQVRAAGIIAPARHPRPAHHSLIGFVARIGEDFAGSFARAYSILGFFGLVCADRLANGAPPASNAAYGDGRPDGANRGQCAADRRHAVLSDWGRHRLSGRRSAAPLWRGDLYGRSPRRRASYASSAC